MIILFTLIFAPLSQAAAQSSANAAEETSEFPRIFDTTGFPQWAVDARRFDIITFGTFPFSMFFVSFLYDIYRWYDYSKMSFTPAGRAYAPWPFRSAGGIGKTNIELRNTILISAGLSIVFAIVDLLIFKNRERRELERIQNSPPSGSFTIIRNAEEDAEPPPLNTGSLTDDSPAFESAE